MHGTWKYSRVEHEFDDGEEVGAALIDNEVGWSIVDIDGPPLTFTYCSATPPTPPDHVESWLPEWRVADRATLSTNGDSFGIGVGESYASLCR